MYFGTSSNGLRKANAHLKAKTNEKGYVILVLIDDFADQGDKVMHSSTNILTSLFVRGRHLGCACWLLTQKLRVVSLICRKNFLLDADLATSKLEGITYNSGRIRRISGS